ncbi:MAG: Gfo/Idh/MocA family oxidoreductase [Rhodospirillales bacterium]|nr:Gfo/Idh/MocA family oxidoreductase [Rhodospirillales bacterium]
MNLHAMLSAREAEGNPVRVGLIGAGKFGSMFLSQVLHTPGMHLVGIADLNVEGARDACRRVHWTEERFAAKSFADAYDRGSTFITDDADALIATDGIDVIIESTGVPEAGIHHALSCFEQGKHVVMVNVEADVLVGPLLTRKAREAGVVYAMAYGDQPALICEQVDWARACGLEVVAAGKGTLFMPDYHASTPDTIWDHYGISAERAAQSGMNAKMFNSFLDGTKSGIEMAAVANATGLTPAPGGLEFPPCAVEKLAQTLIPQTDGGTLHHKGQVEVVSSRDRDGVDVTNNLRWGVYVVYEAPTDYVKNCFRDYGMLTDKSGRYSALWRPYHLIGLELGISVAMAALRGEPTGCNQGFLGDVVATAKRDLKAGEELDGEGGYCVWGKLMPAADSLRLGGLPIGLSHGVTLKYDIPVGRPVRWDDVTFDDSTQAYAIRREMEKGFAA